jgi:DNA-binding transcriptional regulator YiaG
MGELRDLRRAVDLKQEEFAALLAVPLETLRPWDSGRRPPPAQILQRARKLVAERPRNTELLSLDRLARELGVHQRTLRAAARTGRLDVQFASRSVFGRPVRYATRAAGARFMERHYGMFAGQAICPAPLPTVPPDYHRRLKALRRRLGLSQQALARRVGAAGKAVVYQWESRKRTPSPIFWQRVLNIHFRRMVSARRLISSIFGVGSTSSGTVP